jgi:hypothetical protein
VHGAAWALRWLEINPFFLLFCVFFSFFAAMVSCDDELVIVFAMVVD